MYNNYLFHLLYYYINLYICKSKNYLILFDIIFIKNFFNLLIELPIYRF